MTFKSILIESSPLRHESKQKSLLNISEKLVQFVYEERTADQNPAVRKNAKERKAIFRLMTEVRMNTKYGTKWMPRLNHPMKDAQGCDKPR